MDTEDFLSKINSKLDNMGQLRHLNKIVQYLLSIKDSLRVAAIYFQHQNDRHLFEYRENQKLFDQMNAELSVDKRLDVPTWLSVMTPEEVKSFF